MGVCLIVGAGAVASDLHLPLGQDDLLIAADAGWLTVERMGLTPHLVIGDFDSLGHRPDHPNTVVLPTVKDETDMCAAIDPQIMAELAQESCVGRNGKPMDVAKAMAYLADATFVTGHVLSVNGGFVI